MNSLPFIDPDRLGVHATDCSSLLRFRHCGRQRKRPFSKLLHLSGRKGLAQLGASSDRVFCALRDTLELMPDRLTLQVFSALEQPGRDPEIDAHPMSASVINRFGNSLDRDGREMPPSAFPPHKIT